jgi:predicted nucleic acid-binding protein
VRLVIADTSPLNYLILIGHIGVLSILFEKVVLPATVQSELASTKASPFVRHWIANLPAWLEVRDAPLSQAQDASLQGIDAGERAAIQLAASLNADLLLMDDRKGVNAALRKGLRMTGTLGILDLASQRGLADFAQAVEQLQLTNFRVPRTPLDALLEKHKGNSGGV